jgi:CubicO group peptidase (beta-lactamase class C family)
LSWKEFENEFSSTFKDDLKSNSVIGASFAVFDDKNMVWNDSYGFANKSLNESTSTNTRFLIGSITKVFTAVAILQLHEKGIINIDSSVNVYLPEFAINQRFPHSKPITLRDVLTHHAGLPTDIFLHKFAEKPPYFGEILEYLNNHYTCFPVGEIKSYSNVGYALLGMVVEKASGISYQEYVEKNIFSPLAMKNTGFYTSIDLKHGISLAYDISGQENTELPIFDLPAGAIYSTVDDMVKFGKSFLNDGSPLLKPETIRLMFEIQNKEIRLDLFEKSALCFNFKNKAGELGRVLEHGGATMYHRADLYIAPDAKLGCIMLSNSPEGVKNAWKLNEQFMVEYIKHHKIKVAPHTIPEKPFSFTSIGKKDLQSFVGDYAMPGMNCSFQWKHGHLNVNIQGNSFYLLPADEHSFVAAKRVLGFMFI